MIRILVPPVLAALIGGPILTAQNFRSDVEAVRVDVLVTERNRPVAGLTAQDFELRDSGVVQKIESVGYQDVPLRIMLALDVSGSVEGRPLDDLRRAAADLVHLLRDDDRVALLTFSHEVKIVTRWTSAHGELRAALESVRADGATSLYDAAYAALTSRDADPGRALVLMFSDGEDTASWLSGGAVLDAARRTDAVVYAVAVESTSPSGPGYLVDYRAGSPKGILHVAPQLLGKPFLPALASETGGGYIAIDNTNALREMFRRVVEEFRTRYLLTYTARGVDRRGWHPIQVRLKGRQGTVTARRGYIR